MKFLKNKNKVSFINKISGNLILEEFVEINDGVILQNDVNETIKIGKYSQIGPYCCLYGGNITIGEYVMLAPHVVITTANHNYKQIELPMRFAGCIDNKNITIGNDVWIGANSTICCANIGNGAVIGANSFVNHDVPDFAVVAGSPAKIIKYRFSDEVRTKILNSNWWNYNPENAKNIIANLNIENV
ncbi:CatB-related O-acetyltransferase [bacterium]|nr:CatB-related O-acetyltransferase [bacterium]